ncbi:MAG: hypothetical protein RLZZ367_1736, partial [Bacteroidota bacterium]
MKKKATLNPRRLYTYVLQPINR